jgi:hypothetical protein
MKLKMILKIKKNKKLKNGLSILFQIFLYLTNKEINII